MQTGLDYTTLNYFMYAAIAVLSVLIVGLFVFGWRALSNLKKNICFKEVGRIKLGVTNRHWGDYFYRVERLSLDEAVIVKTSLDNTLTQRVRVTLSDLFQWDPQQKEWYVFDGDRLIKYERIKR
jgi:hypothetical protein